MVLGVTIGTDRLPLWEKNLVIVKKNAIYWPEGKKKYRNARSHQGHVSQDGVSRTWGTLGEKVFFPQSLSS